MIRVGGEPLLHLLDGLAKLGLSVVELCWRARIDRSTLLLPGVRVEWEACVQLFAAAADAANDPLVGLHAAEHTESRGILSYLVGVEPDLATGLRQLVRFAAIDVDGGYVELAEGPGTLRLCTTLGSAAQPGERHIREYAAAILVIELRRMTNDRFRALEVRLLDAAAGPVAEYERILQCPVRFRQARAEIVIADDMLTLPLITHCPKLGTILQEVADRELSMAGEAALRARVELLLAEGLRAGRSLSPAAVAASLGMSVRTLQRRLTQEEASFRDARDRARREQAMVLMRRREINIAQVAAKLGFADASAFAKSFRRWTGKAPLAWHRANISARTRPANATT